MPVCADEDVLGLEVTVDDTVSVQPFAALDNFSGIKTSTISA